MSAKKRERATELEYLKWFYQNADFGAAHDDVVDIMKENFREETGKRVPEGYREPTDDEEDKE